MENERHRSEPLLDLADRAEEVGSLAVEFVDQREPRHAVLISLPPDRLALSLDALAGGKHDDRPVEHAKAPLHLGRKVDVAGRVDEVHRHIPPLERHGRRVDRNPPLLLLGIEVGDRGAPINLAEPVARLREEEHPLGERGLPGVDVSDDADVADVFERACHYIFSTVPMPRRSRPRRRTRPVRSQSARRLSRPAPSALRTESES